MTPKRILLSLAGQQKHNIALPIHTIRSRYHTTRTPYLASPEVSNRGIIPLNNTTIK